MYLRPKWKPLYTGTYEVRMLVLMTPGSTSLIVYSPLEYLNGLPLSVLRSDETLDLCVASLGRLAALSVVTFPRDGGLGVGDGSCRSARGGVIFSLSESPMEAKLGHGSSNIPSSWSDSYNKNG